MRVERVRFPRSGLFNQINIGYSPRRGNPAATGEVIPVEVQRLYERMVDDENFTLHWDDEDQRPNEAQRRWLLDFSGPWWFRKGRIDGRELVLNFGRNFRYKWAYDPREAIPEAFHPCEEPDELCPCCGLFGMVAEERAEEISKVRAVAGRIAVGPGQWVGGTQDLQWVQDHKILGTPKYSCRSFYLEPEKRPRDNTPPDVSEDEFLRLEHGRLKPAPARGRKFYWHHTKVWDGRTLDYLERRPLPNGERPLETDQNARIQVLMPDASFEFVVEFENLRPWEMGLLLWVLALPDGEDCAHHLGLGKPIGLGTVKVTIKRVEFIDRKERYESLFATGVKVYEPVNLDAEPFATYLKAFRERMSGWGGTLFHKLPNIADLLVILSTRQPAAAGPNVPITYPPGFEVTDNPSWNPADPAQAPVGESAARQAHPTELHFHWFGSPTRDWVRTLCEIEGIPRPPRRLKGKEWSEGLLDIQAIARGSCQTLVEPLRT
jgi:CRISPR-associated protein (TIGR03986 family)